MTSAFSLEAGTQRLLGQARQRLWLARSMLYLSRCLLVIVFSLVGLIILVHLYPFTFLPQIELTILVVCLVTVVVMVFWRRPRLDEAARAADDRLGGQSRLSTAIQYSQTASYLAQLQRADTERFASSVDASALTRPSPPRSLMFSFLLALVALAFAFWPNPGLLKLEQQQQVLATQQVLANQIDQQAVAAQGVNPTDFRNVQLATQLHQLAQSVRSAPDSQSALANISQTQSNLQSLSDPTLSDKQAGLSQAGQALAGSPAPAVSQAMQAENPVASAQALGQLATQLSSLTPQQKSQLAQSLTAAAKASLQNNPALSKDLQNAAQALTQDNLPAASQALQDAQSTLQAQAKDENFQQTLASSINQLQDDKSSLASALAPSMSVPMQGSPTNSNNVSTNRTSGQGGTQAGQGSSSTSTTGGAGGTPAAASNQIWVPSAASSSDPGQNGNSGSGQQVTLTPYTSVLATYQSQAINQVDRSLIPQEDRDLVKSYFQDLSPTP